MTTDIGINGFGRIGKKLFRILIDSEDIRIRGINDLMDDDTLIHLIRYDSTHGRFHGDIQKCEGGILVNGQRIHTGAHRDPSEIPWKDWGVRLVVESSGLFTNREGMNRHLMAGAEKVLLSCPPSGPVDRTIVIGVNDHMLEKGDRFISNASCTTNCLAPVIMLLEREFGIDRAFMNTVHPFTNNQVIIDAPHKDLRRARTAGVNIIPTTSTAIEALFSVMPEMRGRFDGLAVRVPVHDGSLIEISAILKRRSCVEEVNRLMQRASESEMKDILSCTYDPIVSSDIIGDSHSAIIDTLSTRMLGENFLQMIIWYDNESGYSHRMADLIRKTGKLL